MNGSINALVSEIASVEMSNVFNPWRHVDHLDIMPFPEVQRQSRLASHFNCQPNLLLIGEAPGYQGCHFSGVPFTNEKLLMRGIIPRVMLDGRITSRELPWSEPSATIVWAQLHALGVAETTVMWNAFAWHPHVPGDIHSNRTPTSAELLKSKDVLRAVYDHFKDVPVVAIGRKAEGSLAVLGVKIAGDVRHPAMGGANAFRAGMDELAKRFKWGIKA